MELTAAERLAVSKAISKAEPLPAGSHAVDVTVRIVGTITVGQPEEAKFYPKHDPASMLAVLLEGKTEAEIAEIVKRSKDAPKSEIERVKTAADAAARKGRKPTISNKNGKTTTDLSVTGVNTLEASFA